MKSFVCLDSAGMMSYAIPSYPRYSAEYETGMFGVVELVWFLLLAAGAFWLGACPFSVWIGKSVGGKDIRTYGDGNPGATNVFRSSGTMLGITALILDIAKGSPFVALAHIAFHLPLPKEYVRGNAHTNTAEGYFSLLKRGIIGTYHHISKQHLNQYLNEFNFRYNSRKLTDGVRMILAIEGTEGKRLIMR